MAGLLPLPPLWRSKGIPEPAMFDEIHTEIGTCPEIYDDENNEFLDHGPHFGGCIHYIALLIWTGFLTCISILAPTCCSLAVATSL